MVHRLSLLSTALAAGVVLCGTRAARAQCLDWSNGFACSGTSSSVNALALFDDGGPLGAQLYIGGEFLSAGGANARHLARWTGTSFIPILGGVDAAVDALTVFDDASVSGPALFVGGDIHKAGNLLVNGIAKWNGASWYALGPGVAGRVLALCEYDDGSGSGPALYAAGAFAQAGGLAASNIARWDGAAWTALGGGLDGAVNALAVYDEGSGPRLFAGGQFAHAGAIAVHNCARWDGSTWSAVGGANDGTNAPVRALARYDDPATGSSLLIVAGAFTSAGGTSAARIASWDGVHWSTLGAGMNGSVNALGVYDDGNRPSVVAGGTFASSGAQLVNGVARWDGTSWSAFDAGVSGESARDVRALASFDAGLGDPLLYVGGSFSRAGAVSSLNVARWSTPGWSALKTGAGVSAAVDALALFDDPFIGGTQLYAAGHFLNAGASLANHVARWSGTQWSVLNGGVNGRIAALVRYDDGVSGGPGLYAGGTFTTADVFPARCIARWDGANWSPLGAGIDNAQGEPSVRALAVAPSATGGFPELYVGGEFTHAGGLAARGIARWNGLAWSALDASVGGSVDALLAFDDAASGVPWLYVGGQLTWAGGSASASIARYDGASWSVPGSGLDGRVLALARYDDGLGGGPQLIAAGEFAQAGAVSVHNIARWNGTSWFALGSGLDGVVSSLCVFDDGDGDGPALFAGLRSNSTGTSGELLFKWNGTSWNALAQAFTDDSQPASVHALLVIDQGGASGSDLYVGGKFSLVGLRPSKSFAQWLGCAEPGTPLCAADGSDPLVGVSCPCQNQGLGMRGCAHSSSVAGARLGATGTTGWDPFTLTDQLEFRASGLPVATNGLAVFFQGDALFASAVPFGDGVRCVGGHLIRLAAKPTQAGACHYPDPGEHSISNRGGVSTSSGLTRFYQVWYSDPNASFCTAHAYNATNAYEIVW